MATREKNIWILMVFLLSGLVIGGLLGEIASKVDWLWWLSYGESFGISSPIELDLSVISISFGLMFKINIASIIGMALAIFIYRKNIIIYCRNILFICVYKVKNRAKMGERKDSV